ncbi:Amino acid transporter, transmembrane family-containing protein [Aphelenchoides fujianensis]|nr:Amino acid transporter, transmembrane family-containing protein [Aphelenchoides fujianensis]
MIERRRVSYAEAHRDIPAWPIAASKPRKDPEDVDIPDLSLRETTDGEFVKSHGMHWAVAGLFLVGDMAGGGIVALPTAVLQCGFFVGLVVCGVMALVATTTAVFLGHSWLVLLRLWPEYRAAHCRKPYAEIGFRALGLRAKSLVSVCLNVTQFGVAVVFLLLSAKNIHDFVATFTSKGPDLCVVLLVLGVLLLPITLLKSPEDFWWAIVAGMCSTAIAVSLIVAGAARDHERCAPAAAEPSFRFSGFFGALGTIVFTFCAHATYPQVLLKSTLMNGECRTIQHDMRRPAHFSRSAVMAYGIICLLYAPVVVMAYLTYGDSLRESIINSIQTSWIQQAVNMMIAAHCMLTLALVFNPLNQEAEEFFRVPQEFGIQRILLRSAMMAAVVFTAETMPSFGPVLNLIGASTVTLTCVIFPPLFFLWLVARERSGGADRTEAVGIRDVLRHNDRFVLLLSAFFLFVGVVGGTAATYTAVVEVTGTHFELPCYVKLFRPHFANHTPAVTNCCGAFQNISVHGLPVDSFCSAPNYDFYG